MCGSDEPSPYPVRSFTYSNMQVRANKVQRGDRVQRLKDLQFFFALDYTGVVPRVQWRRRCQILIRGVRTAV